MGRKSGTRLQDGAKDAPGKGKIPKRYWSPKYPEGETLSGLSTPRRVSSVTDCVVIGVERKDVKQKIAGAVTREALLGAMSVACLCQAKN